MQDNPLKQFLYDTKKLIAPIEAFEKRGMICRWLLQDAPSIAQELNDWLSELNRGYLTNITETIEGVHGLAKRIADAPIVIWTKEMQIAALSGQHTLVGASCADLEVSMPDQFWVLQKSLTPSELYSDDLTHAAVNYIFVTKSSDTVFYAFLFVGKEFGEEELDSMDPDTLRKLSRWTLRFVDIHLEEPIDHATSFFVAMQGFANTKIVVSDPYPLPRPERRRLQKANTKVPEIRIIRLRKIRTDDHDTGISHKEWACKWIVQGHWRNQWFPSTKAHKPTYISSYAKGPDDKPLKPPTKSIYMVTR